MYKKALKITDFFSKLNSPCLREFGPVANLFFVYVGIYNKGAMLFFLSNENKDDLFVSDTTVYFI